MVLDFILNLLLAMVIIGLFNLLRGFLRVRKILKKYKDDPTVEGITIVNGKVNVIRKQDHIKESNLPMQEQVTDPICHQMIDKEKAYRMVKDGKEYYFCSWECREQFLKQDQAQSDSEKRR